MSRCLFLLLWMVAQFGQSDTGELRLAVSDPSGLPIQGKVELVSEANQLRRDLETDPQGKLIEKRLPFGTYHIDVRRDGFAVFSALIEIRSALPTEYHVSLGLAPLQTQVTVAVEETLLDLHRTSTTSRIGAETLQHRITALPGRSLPELVNTQPGWLLEANGILHPRGSEYQTQYILDGLPMTDNRSPTFAPEIEADDVHSLNILTAGYPAEYGRKLGGIIEVVTSADARRGLHGSLVASGGSFGTASGYAMGQYGWGRNTLSLSASLARTDRYLDPPVEENDTNRGIAKNLAAHFEREITDADRFGVIVRRAQSNFLVPNERLQQEAGQRQDRTSRETAALFSYQHIVSDNVLGDVRALARNLSAGLSSNTLATPILAQQDRGFRELYVKGTISARAGAHEWKAGVDADMGSSRENFGYQITDASFFDPRTPRVFTFADGRPDREQALFVQDRVRVGVWTVSAGIRWDHYRLAVDESALSPRLAVAWSWPAAQMVVRASYDRAFQTPAVENLLLASSSALDSLNENVVRLPVRPSLGNFYEAGFSKGLLGKLRIDVTHFRRDMTNFADDDLLLNTGVSFPIAFRKAHINGTEAKLELPHWGAISGFVSYANQRGVGFLPITGGLFLGEASTLLTSTGQFPVTQDQRNTVRSRASYQVSPRAWVALATSYGSGLPVAFAGDREQAVAQYGQRIVDRVDLARGRVRPTLSLDGSTGFVVAKTTKHSLRLQADVLNLTGRLNVIDFAGLFSGTALGAPRSFAIRLQSEF